MKAGKIVRKDIVTVYPLMCPYQRLIKLCKSTRYKNESDQHIHWEVSVNVNARISALQA